MTGLDMRAMPTLTMLPTSQRATVDISVVVPVTERPDSLVELYREFSAPLRASGRPFEFVVVAHPYFRHLTAPLAELGAAGEPVQVLEAGRSIGETALLRFALPHCQGRTIITLPAYRQVEARAIPELLAALDEGADFATACRFPRRDGLINRMQSKALHLLIGRVNRNGLSDVACGVRAMRREVLDELPLYGDLGRFLPLLAVHHGHTVREVPIEQHPRNTAQRVYSPGVYIRRLIDVLGLLFLMRFTEKPLRFFGLFGSVLAGSGGLLLTVLLAQRVAGQPIADRPLLLLGVLLVTIGLQAIALGLIGEMIVHFNASRRRIYRVRPTPQPTT